MHSHPNYSAQFLIVHTCLWAVNFAVTMCTSVVFLSSTIQDATHCHHKNNILSWRIISCKIISQADTIAHNSAKAHVFVVITLTQPRSMIGSPDKCIRFHGSAVKAQGSNSWLRNEDSLPSSLPSWIIYQFVVPQTCQNFFNLWAGGCVWTTNGSSHQSRQCDMHLYCNFGFYLFHAETEKSRGRRISRSQTTPLSYGQGLSHIIE